MTNKARIAKLEQVKQTGAARVVVWWDDAHGDSLAKFDGVEMTQAEAEAKAAALPEDVLLIHVTHSSSGE
jgi:hypothetical protein